MQSSQDMDLTNRIAVVTGGGRGLGRAYALMLAAAGATVAVIARSKAQVDETVSIIQGTGGLALAIPADVADPQAVERAMKSIEEQLGAIDLLVNNAGIAGPAGPFWQSDPDEWWNTLEVNFRGALLCTRYVLPAMLDNARGRLINISSDAGGLGIPYISAYGLSKTALIRFTETLAIETAGSGVSVFAISPGTVKTNFIEEILTSDSLKWMPWLADLFEDGRDASPAISARLLLQLASGKYDALSGLFITIEDDLDELLKSVDQIDADSLYSLRVNRLGS
jgi:NAD(P)-dependent dehydrogenase (short-subunit alcohol dehydrogenase family)